MRDAQLPHTKVTGRERGGKENLRLLNLWIQDGCLWSRCLSNEKLNARHLDYNQNV